MQQGMGGKRFLVALGAAARAVGRVQSLRAQFGFWGFYLFAAALPQRAGKRFLLLLDDLLQ